MLGVSTILLFYEKKGSNNEMGLISTSSAHFYSILDLLSFVSGSCISNASLLLF